MEKTSYVYGPVPSRRLGFSLGVDLIPYKFCPLDCIYCQLGRTTRLTTRRTDYVPVGDVLAELEATLRTIHAPDFITLSGSGEPTLHSGIGVLIEGIRKISRVPVAVLTNGVFLGEKDVQAGCLKADVVIPSLDAGDEEGYLRVNRPMAGLSFQSLVEGIRLFRELFHGEIWLEVMILAGLTDSDAEVGKIASMAREISPHKIHLNTAVRPPAEESARAVSFPELERIAAIFQPRAEVIFEPPPGEVSPGITMDKVFTALERRPCTIQDIALVSGISPVEVVKIVEEMMREKRITRILKSGRPYYAAPPEGTI